MNMKLYMTPGSCSTGIHILLEELEQVFEVYLVNLLAGDNRRPEYLAMNPNGTIPTLVTPDGSPLTDWQSIAWWLGKRFAKGKFLPGNEGDRELCQWVMDMAGKKIHGDGFPRIFVTDAYTRDEGRKSMIHRQGEKIVQVGFEEVPPKLEGRKYVLGEQPCIADFALFYVEFWADRTGIALPQPLHAHYQRMLRRPAVRQVLSEEGYGSMFR
ncbi:glutathione S-transferase family protein [Thauera sedimentorum]|nr:glutathione S-transferase family protein [Thauera sedimentorum]